MQCPSRSFIVVDEYGNVAGEFSVAHSNCILNILEITEDRRRDAIGFMAHVDRIGTCLEAIKNPDTLVKTTLQNQFHAWLQKRDGLPDDDVDDASSRCCGGSGLCDDLVDNINKNIYDINKVYDIYNVYSTPPEHHQDRERDGIADKVDCVDAAKVRVQVEFLANSQTTSSFFSQRENLFTP